MSSSEPPFAPGERPTEIGPFSGAQVGAGRPRPIPVPWIDCVECGWRHYPSTTGGAWHIATSCVSCGEPLPNVTDHPDPTPEVPDGIETADDTGEARP
jgi:hypothetical protein